MAVGYLGTLADRLVDREIVSLVFVVATLIGYWALVWLAGLDPWPAGLVRMFAVLMAVGEAIKVALFISTGATVRRLPRSLPIVMTSLVTIGQVVIAATVLTTPDATRRRDKLRKCRNQPQPSGPNPPH